jgi:hypothetical protein
MVDRRAALLDALDALDYIEGLQTDIPRPQSPPLLPRQGTA